MRRLHSVLLLVLVLVVATREAGGDGTQCVVTDDNDGSCSDVSSAVVFDDEEKTKPARIRKDKSKYQSGSTNSEISDPIKTVAKYGEPQRVEGQEIDKIMDVIVRTIHYMEIDIHGPNATHTLSTNLVAECRNKHQDCAFWAAIGECEKNPSYMKINCSPSCQTCVLLDIANRCPPLDDDVRPGLHRGGVNAMFERIVTTAPGNQSNTDFVTDEGMTNYTVIVHSRPTPLDDGVEPIISEKRDLHEPPWVITFDDFITVDECKHLIDLGYKTNYKRSEDVGHALPDGTFTAKKSETRTSENAWCSYSNGCRNDTVVTRIHDRIAKVTGIEPENSEDFQVLKYEPGQFYRVHHDYIPHQRDRRCGPRILTFFLYLSDVDEGGATNFPKLEIAVKPKAGRALLWPSVLDSNPKEKEPRTDHEAQNVIKGIKFGANAWLHLYNYVDAKEMGCT